MHLILLCKSVFVYGPWNVMCGPAQQWEGLHSLVLTVLSLNWTQIWGKKFENTQYIRKVLQLTTAFVDLVLMRIQTWFDPFCPLYSCVNHLTDRQLNKCHRLLAVFTGTMPTLEPCKAPPVPSLSTAGRVSGATNINWGYITSMVEVMNGVCISCVYYLQNI